MSIFITDLLRMFNWKTVLAAIGGISIGLYILRKVRKFVSTHSRQIVDGVFWIIGHVASRSISATLSMRTYCRIQLGDEALQYLHIPGARDIALDVDNVYVPLTLETGHRERIQAANDENSHGRILVVGDPGSGKSTFTKKQFRDACKKAIKRPRTSRLPIHIELKSLSAGESLDSEVAAGNWLFYQLREQVSAVQGYEMLSLFDSCVTGVGILALLDGLDEVSGSEYPTIALALRGLSRRLARSSAQNTVIVTTRTQFYQQVRIDLVETYPQVAYVQPFLPNEIYLFLTRWPFTEQKEQHINRIYAELTDRPTLREMCRNPLVLAMYVVSDLESDAGSRSESRTEFYRNVVTELLVMRRRRQDLLHGRALSLREQRESLLGVLALENLMDTDQAPNSISWHRAIQVACSHWKCSEVDAGKWLRELAREAGIFNEERNGESIHFIHLTFCEFLAAVECASGRENGWTELLSAHRGFVQSPVPQVRSRLIEVIPFANALLPRMKRSAALRDVAELGDRLVLGRCFLETQMYDSPVWESYVVEEEQYLASTYKSGWSEPMIRRLHLFGTVIRDASDWAEQVARRESGADIDLIFSEIISGDDSTFMKVFGAYVKQDPAAALRLADQLGVDMIGDHLDIVIKSCEEQPFLALAVERALDDKNIDADIWIMVLMESALRFANVAHRLNRLDGPSAEVWGKLADPKKGDVSEMPFLGRTRPSSMYEYIFTKAALSRQTPGENFVALDIVRALNGHLFWLGLLRRWSTLIGTFLVTASAILLGIYVVLHSAPNDLGAIGIIVPYVISIYFIQVFMGVAIRGRELVSCLLNIHAKFPEKHTLRVIPFVNSIARLVARPLMNRLHVALDEMSDVRESARD